MQLRCNSSANALELHLFCIKQSISWVSVRDVTLVCTKQTIVVHSYLSRIDQLIIAYRLS